MKKILALMLAMALSLALFVGCGGDDPSSEGNSSSQSGSSSESSALPAYDVEQVLEAIESAVPVSSGKEIDDDTLTLLMNVDMENVEAYAGKITQLNQNTDQILVIQAKPGKADAVKTELEARRQAMVDSSANYSEFAGEKVKAENGRVVVKGDYVVLVIVGDSQKMLDEGPDDTYKAVDKAIDEAFN